MKEKEQHLRQRIISKYVKTVNRKGRPPRSVYWLCQKLDIDEKTFYRHFPSLEAVAIASWTQLLHETADIVENDPDFAHYGLQEKLVAFLYTYLQNAQEHRGYLAQTWPGPRPGSRTLQKLSCAYRGIAKDWVRAAAANGEITHLGRSNRVFAQVFALHFLAVVDFWLRDESSEFERTDAFVEKTVRLAMDLIRRGPLDSAVDLARFFAGGWR